MLKKLFIILLLFILLLFLASTLKLNKNTIISTNILSKSPINNILNFNTTENNTKNVTKKDNIFGKIIIDKLNINRNLYSVDSEENNVDKNITILKNSTTPDHENSIMFIAAHSGTGRASYFKHLDNLTIGDEIKLIYKDKTYYYKVKNIWEEKKDGDINILREEQKQLILTTCSPTKDNMQLVINCVEEK